MKQEIGLKGIYRFLGRLIAKLLTKLFKPFNPNIITVCGFLIYIIGVGIFTIYGKKATYDVNLFIFIIGTQLALILDFTDGSYARMVSKTSHYGRILDSFLGTLEIMILFGLAYFIAGSPTEKCIVIGLVLIYAFDQRAKLITVSQSRENSNKEERTTLDNKTSWEYLIKIPIGFTFAHFYLYVTLWFLFNSIYFLFVLYIVGLFSIASRIKRLSREYSERD